MSEVLASALTTANGTEARPAREYLAVFRMPSIATIYGRASTVTSQFGRAVMPVILPTGEEVREALSALGMDLETIACAYCGDTWTEWDHLRPIIKNKTPTGYISEIHNLVPACGKCNQSKGNKEWRDWMMSSAPLSPTRRGVPNLVTRILHLEAFETWSAATRLDFRNAAGDELWAEYEAARQNILNGLKDADLLASKIREKVRAAYEGLSD